MAEEFIHEGVVYTERIPRIALVNFSGACKELKAKHHNVYDYPCWDSGNVKQVTALKPAHDIEILMVRDHTDLETIVLPAMFGAKSGSQQVHRPFGNEISIPTGKGTIQQYCRGVFERGGACVFFVSHLHGSFLKYSGLWMEPDDGNRAITKTASFRPINPPGFEALSSFVDNWRKTPEQYVSIKPSIKHEEFLQDGGGNKLVVLHRKGNVAKPGIVLCLPDYGDRADVLHALLNDVLPELSPHLFPYRFDTSWQQEATFVHPSVVALEKEKATIRSKAEEEIAKLDQAIEGLRATEQYLLDILLLGDDPLKKAVQQALKELLRLAGMSEVQVLDVDEDPALRVSSRQKREDLRFELGGQMILINVAGNDSPLKESRINQLDKHERLYLGDHPEDVNKTHSVLIANFNKRGESNPLTRGEMFGSGTAQANERLKDAGHRAISTLDLFKLIRAAQRNDFKLGQAQLEALFLKDGILSFEDFVKDNCSQTA